MSETPDRFVELVDNPVMLQHLDYLGDQADISVPGSVLQFMPFEVDNFVEDGDYLDLVDFYKRRGYSADEPISVHPSVGGRWVVDEDHAARFMAAKAVANDFFANIVSQKVRRVRLVLHAQSADGLVRAPHAEFGWGGD